MITPQPLESKRAAPRRIGRHRYSAAEFLIALVVVFAYLLVARAVPDAFAFNAGPAAEQSLHGANAFYFSFITLCTVGYGDITPVSHVARMLAAMEAITGTLYVAVLISRLVALYSSEKLQLGAQKH